MEKKRDSFLLKMKRDGVKQGKNRRIEEVEERKNKRLKEFNKNRKGLDVKNVKTEKKPFDKKAYRLKKYSKKYKLEQWEEKRKKRLLREYHKDIKNDPILGTYTAKKFDEDTTDATQEAGKYVRHPDLVDKEISDSNTKIKKDPFRKAKEHFNKVKQEKLEKQEEIQRIKEEKKQKLDEYKKKKHDRFKKLSKKTKKGQPVMTGRLEILLEKIQSNK